MQCFAFFFIVAMIGLVVNVAGNLSPIDGYKMVDITWTVQPEIPGALPFNLTGTVQDVWEHINTTWPGYPLPKMDWPLPPPDRNLTDGHLICGFPTGFGAKMLAIQDGIDHLRSLPGKPGLSPGPGACARVSCANQSAIWWCNDHDDVFWLDNFDPIADGANDINFNCITARTQYEPPEVLIWTKGQIFFDKWNVVIRGDDDDC